MTGELTVVDAVALADRPELPYPDVYFTPGYGLAAAVAESGSWQLAYCPDKIMIPYVRRPLAHGLGDAVSPYGYSGVHVGDGCDPGELAHLWSTAVAGWRDAGLVSLFLRFSPLDPSSVAAVGRLSGVVLTRRADTVTVGLAHGPAAAWEAMAGRSRTAVRKARRVGLEAAVRPADVEDVSAGSPFRQLYTKTMLRVASAPGYHFSDSYYTGLVEGLGKALHVAEVRDTGGRVVAAALVLWHRDRAHYHLAGSDPAAARDGANNLLLWTIFEWAADSGCTAVHLGGGVRPDDGLFQFKSSFGGVRTPFWTGSVVLDPSRYEALLTARADQLGRSHTELRDSGFFPAYRWGCG